MVSKIVTGKIAALRAQRTLSREVSLRGMGLHTGRPVSLRFVPQEVNAGLFFQRTDLEAAGTIPACCDHVLSTNRCTTVGSGDNVVHTIEHVLAALHAARIDNLCICVDGPEMPVVDGSSAPFVAMIEEAGISEQNEPITVMGLTAPVYFRDKDTFLAAFPSDHFEISYTLHYPEVPAIDAQYCFLSITHETFKAELSSCRTFAKYEELSYLIDKGLIKGGSLDNAVVLLGDAILSKDGLRFPNEMVRHKALDLVGDLCLVGRPFCAHVVAVKSGHSANVALARAIKNALKVTVDLHEEAVL